MNRIERIQKEIERFNNKPGYIHATGPEIIEWLQYLLSLNEGYQRTFRKIQELSEIACEGVTDYVKREQIDRIGQVARVAVEETK